MFTIFQANFSHFVSQDQIRELVQGTRAGGRAKGLQIQFLNEKAIMGWRHLDTAFLTAINNFSNGRNLSSDIGMEILLMLSGQRQIKKALKLFAIDGESGFLAMVFSHESYLNLVDDFTIDNISRLFREAREAREDREAREVGEASNVLGERFRCVIDDFPYVCIKGVLEKKDAETFHFKPTKAGLSELFTISHLESFRGQRNVVDLAVENLPAMEKAVCEKICMLNW